MSQESSLKHGQSYQQNSRQYAPSFNLPSCALVSIEHPFIVNDLEKAISSLGGTSNVHSVSQPENNGAVAKLFLRPNDPMSKPIMSANILTNNILLKITVPKRTGLKRRRGAHGPYHEGIDNISVPSIDTIPQKTSLASNDTHFLLHSLRDNIGNYEVQPIGTINQTHRFRNMSDFAFATTNSPFMKKMREKILPFEYKRLKNFRFDMGKGPQPNIDLIPPPRWSHVTIPFNYSYIQNLGLKEVVDDSGNIRTENHQKALPARNQPIPYDSPVIPIKPADGLDPISSLEPPMQRLVKNAQALFEKRPIWTRRALRNSISATDYEETGSNGAKYLYQYVGYLFESGPWRDAIVKFGVDPRKDPNLRIYQTMMFILDKEYSDSRRKIAKAIDTDPSSRHRPISRETHMFEGNTVDLDGKVWQVCDITDPLLKSILSTTHIREKCHIHCDGWYHSGTWAKAKIIMKAKITTILAGQIPNDNDYFRVIHELPEIIDEKSAHLCSFPKNSATSLEIELAAKIRTTAKKYQWGDFKQRALGNDAFGYPREEILGDRRSEGEESAENIETDDEDDGYEKLDEHNTASSFLLDPLLIDREMSGKVPEMMPELSNIEGNVLE